MRARPVGEGLLAGVYAKGGEVEMMKRWGKKNKKKHTIWQ
jgi:hypothetical protein